jgi:hypothetical protein
MAIRMRTKIRDQIARWATISKGLTDVSRAKYRGNIPQNT